MTVLFERFFSKLFFYLSVSECTMRTDAKFNTRQEVGRGNPRVVMWQLLIRPDKNGLWKECTVMAWKMWNIQKLTVVWLNKSFWQSNRVFCQHENCSLTTDSTRWLTSHGSLQNFVTLERWSSSSGLEGKTWSHFGNGVHIQKPE